MWKLPPVWLILATEIKMPFNSGESLPGVNLTLKATNQAMLLWSKMPCLELWWWKSLSSFPYSTVWTMSFLENVASQNGSFWVDMLKNADEFLVLMQMQKSRKLSWHFLRHDFLEARNGYEDLIIDVWQITHSTSLSQWWIIFEGNINFCEFPERLVTWPLLRGESGI